MIDIIIPAYNAKNTINKTLLSICEQTISDKVNVFIINDCSKYSYNQQIELFKEFINIIEIKLEKNMGPGYARQYGVDNSNGDYIYFLDADDVFMDCFSLENLYNCIQDNDIVSGKVFYESEHNEIKAVSNKFTFQLHGKLYSRKYINDNNFRFNNSRNGEDNCYNRLLKIGTEKYAYCENNISLYSYQKNSITNCENYLLKEIDKLTDNMLWMSDEALKRNFNKDKITFELYSELVHFINVYMLYFDTSENINNIFIGFKKIYKKIIELDTCISLDKLYEIYCNNYEENLNWKRFYFILNIFINKAKEE